jgi:PASTA domain
MSETAPERPSGGGGSVFTRKVGPLSMWMWMLIALLLAIGYYLLRKNKSSTSATASSANPAGTGGSAGTTDQSLVPQFVNQTYVDSSPPAAPAVNFPSTLTIQNGGTQSTGGTISMPNVIGQNTTQASAALKGAGLGSPTLSGPKPANGQLMLVAFQNPKAGAAVSPTTPVTLGYETITAAANGKGATETQLVNGKPVTKPVSTTNPPGNPPATSG